MFCLTQCDGEMAEIEIKFKTFLLFCLTQCGEMAKIQFRMCTVISQNFPEPCKNIACCWYVFCSNLGNPSFHTLFIGELFLSKLKTYSGPRSNIVPKYEFTKCWMYVPCLSKLLLAILPNSQLENFLTFHSPVLQILNSNFNICFSWYASKLEWSKITRGDSSWPKQEWQMLKWTRFWRKKCLLLQILPWGYFCNFGSMYVSTTLL